MPLQVLPAMGPEDMYRCAVIENRAYGTYASNAILFPGPFPPDVLVTRGQEMQEQCEQPGSFCFKVVDTDLEGDEQMIAFAKWTIYDDQKLRSDEGSKPAAPARSLPPGTNVEACAMFFGSLAGSKKRNIGDRPHVFLGTLNTDPKHSRRGAGALLLQWGIEEGRKRGLPVYLHSSLQGHALYLKHGFRDLEELVADFSKWGLEERNYNWAMVKEP